MRSNDFFSYALVDLIEQQFKKFNTKMNKKELASKPDALYLLEGLTLFMNSENMYGSEWPSNSSPL